MTLLLDTHAFLWWLADDPALPAPARDAIADPSSRVLVSAASAWEIAIKAAIGKLTLPEPPEAYVPDRIARAGFEPLPITVAHVLGVGALPPLHRDPFDRLLVAQARAEGARVVSGDPLLRRYDVALVW